MSATDKVRAAIWRVPVGLQLSALYTLLFIVSLSLLGWVLYSQLDHFLVQNRAAELQRTAGPVLEHGSEFDRGGPGGPGRGPGNDDGYGDYEGGPPPFGDFTDQRTLSRIVRELSAPDVTVAVLDSQGEVITSTVSFDGEARIVPALPDGWMNEVALPSDGGGAAYGAQWMVTGADRRELVVVQAANLIFNGGYVYVLQAASMDSADAVLNQLAVYLVLGVIIGTVAGVFVVLWLTRTVLRPLDKMSRTAAAIAAGDLNMRLKLPEGSNEVAQLGGAFDHMVDRLAASLQAQRRFVADASHELRTPLTSLEGMSEMLLMGADRGDSRAVQRMAKSMHGELGRMARLVSDLLTLSRLDAAAPMKVSAVDAVKLLENVVEQVTPMAEAREIKLNVIHLGESPILVPADPDRLKQVVLNLVDNALRYTPAEGEVRLAAKYTATGQVQIEVKDTGPGLAPEDVEHIFDRFYRGDPSRARSTGNMGLGLSIVHSIVQAHGGTIEARSVPGEGACFVVTLPGFREQVSGQVSGMESTQMVQDSEMELERSISR